MSLSDLASLGSFVSGFAVLVSLVYLALQVRQAERNQRAVLNERFVSRAIEATWRYAESPTLIELRGRMNAGDTTFTADELLILTLQFRGILLSTQDVWLQNKSGLLDEPTLDASMRTFKNAWLSQPVYRALWVQASQGIGPEFRTAVDEMIKETPLAKPADHVVQFNADLAKVMA
jgi:hypothetical protein